ncbi:MAG: CehA/McbA family metallohydrolase [Sedimentisphaeraceae bacterium JB056]
MCNFLRKVIILAIFALPAICWAHGVDTHKYEMAGENESVEIADPIPGAQRFAQRLAENSRNIFTSQQLELLHDSNSHFKMHDKYADTDEEKSMRSYSLGQEHLLELLEEYDGCVKYDMSKGYTDMAVPRDIEVPMEYGSVLLKVITGDDSFAFNEVKVELESYTEHEAPIDIELKANSVNWVLLGLWNVPNQSTGFFLNFKLEDKDYPGAIKVISPPHGELEVEIVDEFGKPVPAMVRLTSKKTDTLYRPANALVFDWQMDNIAGYPKPDPDIFPDLYGKPYPASMPSPYGGHYWYLPEGFDMAMPAGNWEVHINHGFEYEPVFETVAVEAGKKTRKIFRLKRWINMPEMGWYSGDDHIHSRLMSDADAEKLLMIIRAADVHVGNVLMMGNSYRTFFEQRGYGKDYRVQDGNYVLIPGMEDPRHFYGHAIGTNLARLVRKDDMYLDNVWIADNVNRDGGVYGQAHVLFNIFNIIRDIAVLLPLDKTYFGEIMQSGLLDTSVYYDFLNLGYKYAASTGSDMPFGHAVGEAVIYVYTGKGEFSSDKWFQGLKDGKTFVTNGPIIDFRVDDAIPGEEIHTNSNRKVKVYAKAMGIPGITSPKELQVIRFGEVYKSKISDDPQKSILEMEFEMDTEYGCWIALKAISHNEAQAHTTPVYIIRDGYRFWDVTKAQKVIDRCYGVFDGMEAELKNFMQQHESGNFPPSNLYGPHLAETAPGALENFEVVKKIYAELEDTLEKEKQLRK